MTRSEKNARIIAREKKVKDFNDKLDKELRLMAKIKDHPDLVKETAVAEDKV